MSLKIIENGTIWKLGYGFLFGFRNNGRIFRDFGDSVKEWPDLKMWVGVVQGRWKWCSSLEHVFYFASFSFFSLFFIVAASDGEKSCVYVFILVCHCNYSSILYHFRVIWRWIISWPWYLAETPLKIIETGAIWKLGCGFLFAFYSNYGRICNRLWDIQLRRMVWLWKQG